MMAEILFGFSILIYIVFWIWAIHHVTHTPRATTMQRALWGIAMVANPSTAVWYWYVWRRKAFWTLFTPILIAFLSFPFIVRSFLSKTDETAITNMLYGLGNARLVILIATLMIFPLVIKLAALFHLGKNTALSAMDRNDWIVSLSLPVFGFGAAIAYCTRFRRTWAMAGLLWWVVLALALKTVALNITHALIPAGEERRAEFQLRIKP